MIIINKRHVTRVKALFIAALSLAVSASVARASTYYLDPANGNDGNAGTESSPWKTIFKVKTSTSVQPGDIIYVEGGTYTKAQYKGETGDPIWRETNRIGTAGAPITIQSKPGEQAIFEGGETSVFTYLYGTSAYAGHFIVFKDLKFIHFKTPVFQLGDDAGNLDNSNAPIPVKAVAIINCAFDDIYDSTSGAVTHLFAQNCVIRGNNFFNIGDTSLGFNNNGDHAVYVAEGSSHIVVENNVARQIAGFGVHGYGGHGDTSYPITDLIVRGNTIINTRSSGFVAAGTSFIDVYVYNNTFYNTAAPFPQISSNDGTATMDLHLSATRTNLNIKNNIGYGPLSQANIYVSNSAQLVNLKMDCNLWSNTNNVNSLYNWNAALYGLAAFKAATSYDQNSKTGDPLFTNAAAWDFTLQSGSTARDAGTSLTTTTGSGSNSTIVAVVDAGFFANGFGLVAGDSIKVGTNNPVTVTAVNYSTNTITVSPAITWSTGQGVSLPYTGTAPDMGAHEFGGSGAELVGHWKLDETSGTTAADSSGNAHNGTLTNFSGTYWVAGQVDNGLTFDGVDDSLNAGSGAALDNLPAVTVAAWIKATSMGEGGYGRIVHKAGVTGPTAGWAFYVNGTNQLSFSVDYATTDLLRISNANAISTGTWVHVAVTWSGSATATNAKIYVNGTEITYATTVNGAGTRVDDGASNLYLGNDSSGARTFNGSLDDVRVYNYALNSTDITALYQSGLGSPEINVTGNSVTIADGDTTPQTADNTDFGGADIATGSVTKVFNIQNTGTSTLTLSGFGTTPSTDFGLLPTPPTSIPAGGNANFSVAFNPTATGLLQATLSFSNNDANENPYNFTIQGTGTSAPEVNVTGNSVTIADGDTTPQTADNTDFGSADINTGAVQKVFNIQNTGSGTLTLGTVTAGGDFALVSGPGTSIAPGGNANFTIEFNPSASGLRTATINFSDNDADENPYSFSVQGNGTGGPPSAPSTLAAADVAYNQINLTWTDTASDETGFKIERKKGASGTYAQIGTAGANATSYNDTTAGTGTTYYYRVRAYNAYGDSTYSSEANDTTPEVAGRAGHWKLNETSGTTTADSSGNANNGTLSNFSGTYWVAGQINNGLTFDGADDSVNAGSGATLDNLSTVTVAAWIKATSMGEGGYGRIVHKAGVTGPTAGWAFYVNGTNQLSFSVDYSTTDLVRISSTNAISPGTWTHVMATWTGSATATNIKIYVNGAEITYATTVNGVGTRVNDGASNLHLGNDSSGARTFNGVLDDVRVYNTALSAAELTAIYRAGQ